MCSRICIWGYFLVCAFFLISCGDDELKSAETISAKKLALNRDRTLGVDFTYSDSAVVKAKGFAPILDKVTEPSGTIYQEMPKGVKVDFFEQTTIKGSITSDYAIRREAERTTVFRKNVVVTYPDGMYQCEELTWDESRQKYLSPRGVYTKKDGTVLNAANFDAAQDFSRVSMSTATAEVYTKP